MTPSDHRTALVLALIGLLTLGLYAPSLGNGFAMDDALVVRPMLDDHWPNEMVHEVRPLAEYFSTNYHHGSGHVGESYRPLTVLSYAVVNRLQAQPVDPVWGARPHHALNLLLHLVATLLVFALLQRFGARRAAALAGTLVFGVHAIHSEAVVNIVGRAELLAFCLGATAMLLSVSAIASPRRGAGWLAVAAAPVWFAALCSQESAIAWMAFTPVFCIARRWQVGAADGSAELGGPGWRPGWRALSVALSIAAALAVFWHLRAAMIAGLPTPPPVPDYVANPLAHVDTGTRVSTALMLWGMGLGKTLLPLGGRADYGAVTVDLVSELGDPRLLVAVLVLAAFLGVGIVLARRHPLLLLAAAAFFGFGLITSNIPRPIGTIFGERLYYAPSLAASCLVAWLVERGAGSIGGCRVLLGVWVLISGAVVLERNPVWKDDATLFTYEAKSNPRSVRMLVCAASVRLDEGDRAAAAELLRQAVELLPGYGLALNNLGAVLLDLEQLPEAEEVLRRAVDAEYPLTGPHRARIHANLATALERLGRLDEAREALERAARLDSGNRALRRRLEALESDEPPAVPRRSR